MDAPQVIPEFVRNLAMEKLREVLASLFHDLRASQANVCFVESDGLINVPPQLRLPSDHDGVMQLHWTQGLTGLAIKSNKSVVWPLDKESEGAYRVVDSTVVSEIAGPINFGGGVGGAAWVDRRDPNDAFDASDKEVFVKALIAMSDYLKLAMQSIDDSPSTLRNFAHDCLVHTKSERGYVAVRRVDGLLEYIPVGSHPEVFLGLSQFEGLCGEVFQTGIPLNVGNVHSHPQYIPSDPDIKSELIVPVLAESENRSVAQTVIGVINLESCEENAYHEDAEIFVKKRASEAGEAAYLFRERVGRCGNEFLAGLVDVFFRLDSRRGQCDSEGTDFETRMMQQMCGYAKESLGANSLTWIGDDDSSFLTHFRDSSIEEVVYSVGPDRIVGRVLVGGDTVGLLLADWNKGFGSTRQPEFEINMRQLCYYMGRFLDSWREKERRRKFIQLVEMMCQSIGDESTLLDSICTVPQLLDSRHCTLFYKTESMGDPRLVPGPSSVREFPVRELNRSYYHLDEASGLTPWVAVTGRELRLANVEDHSELRKVCRTLRWAARVPEIVETRPRAFMCLPVRNSAGTVNGVIRTFRDVTNRRSVFTDEDLSMLRVIAHLIGPALESMIMRKRSVQRT